MPLPLTASCSSKIQIGFTFLVPAHPGSLGLRAVNQVCGVWAVTSVLWRCWLGGRKGIWPVKTEWWDAGIVICLERGADLHMAQLIPLPLTLLLQWNPISFTFLALVYPRSPRKWLLNVCIYVCMSSDLVNNCWYVRNGQTWLHGCYKIVIGSEMWNII